MNMIKKKLFKISKAGFLICGTLFVLLVILTKLQQDRLLMIPENMVMWFLLIFLMTLLSFSFSFLLDMIEEIRAKRWSTVIGTIGLLGAFLSGMFLWDTRLLAVPVAGISWLCKAFVAACAMEAGAYMLSRKME